MFTYSVKKKIQAGDTFHEYTNFFVIVIGGMTRCNIFCKIDVYIEATTQDIYKNFH